MNATVTSDIYNAGTSEDGDPFYAERFFVVVEKLNGRRFQHQSYFNSTSPYVTEDGFLGFPDLREEAEAKAYKLATRVNAANKIDPQFWFEVDPVYGSDAYVSQGTESKRYYEERNGY